MAGVEGLQAANVGHEPLAPLTGERVGIERRGSTALRAIHLVRVAGVTIARILVDSPCVFACVLYGLSVYREPTRSLGVEISQGMDGKMSSHHYLYRCIGQALD